jgi:hypothetical protein
MESGLSSGQGWLAVVAGGVGRWGWRCRGGTAKGCRVVDLIGQPDIRGLVTS